MMGRKWPRDDMTTITFSEKDTAGVRFSHNDVLVVTLQMEKTEVRSIMVDQGSSAEITYYFLFQKLGEQFDE
ncbi:hypothetical protein HS088_TW04G01351 [Tripterygium wilfordii]|uniref:Uncharacterized protein n=1 Tax=Tripterygium wilfordii TaxID=458696 RepID=A0A7J7DSK8_TRIWF|nr:hypothetical protein HS088_TW04G01351 [Tripterygium wilfordii]